MYLQKIVAILFSVFLSHSFAGACERENIQLLRKFDENGSAILIRTESNAAAARTFSFFLNKLCGRKRALALGAAIHETVHILSLTHSNRPPSHTFVLIDDQEELHFPIGGTMVRKEVYNYLTEDERNEYAAIYLRGQSGEQGFSLLLEELNAYTNGEATAISVSEGLKENYKLNMGLTWMMYYIQVYLYHVMNLDPQTIDLIGRKENVQVVLKLWRQAENVLVKSIKSPFVEVNGDVLRKIYSPVMIDILSRYTGIKFNSPLPEILNKNGIKLSDTGLLLPEIK